MWTIRDGAAPLGRPLATQPFPFRAYTWGSLWADLRAMVPEGATYRSGTAVSGVDLDEDGATLHLADGERRRFDAVIGADGYRSAVRDAAFPRLEATYAGYVAWRGTSAVIPDGAPDVDEAATVGFPGGHCMMYRVPAPSGGLRYNWVLYTAPPASFQEGLRRPTSLPPGRLATELTEHLRAVVADHFPPYWATCLLSTAPEETLIQPIYDLEVPHYATGRVLLVGDAATVARPHTGGGSVKAMQDAAALEEALRASATWQEAIAGYDRDRRAVGADMVALGRRMGSAQVEATPEWGAMDEEAFAAWWREQQQGADRLGGHALRGA